MFGFGKKTKEITISIEGMSCNHCVNSVKKGISALSGVKSVDVSLEKKSAKISYNEAKLEAKDIVKCVNELGFKAALR